MSMNTEPLTVTITVSGPEGSGSSKAHLLQALEASIHDAKVGTNSVAGQFRLLQSNSFDHTIEFKGFRV